MWSDEGSYVVKEKDFQNQEGVQLDPQVNFPGNVVDFKTKVRELLDKKGRKIGIAESQQQISRYHLLSSLYNP